MGDRDKWERDDEMPRRQRSLTFSGPSRGSEGRAPSDRYRRYLISNSITLISRDPRAPMS
jgi:hypothetical protein